MTPARPTRRLILLATVGSVAVARLGGTSLGAQPAEAVPYGEIAVRIAREVVIPRTRARQAVTRLVTDHLAALQAVAEAKLGAVLGKNPDEARPLLAESWRSGRSSRAIRLNLDAAEALSRAALAGDGDALASVLAGLDTARSVAGELAADPKRRRTLVLLRDAVASARETSGPVLAEALRITIGFNSRDGD